MTTVSVKFGSDSYSRSYDDGSTVMDMLSDSDLKLAAGFGDNVRVVKSGVQQGSTTRLEDGGVYVIETAANSKAVEDRELIAA